MLNDGTAIVLFVVLFAVVTGETTFEWGPSIMGFVKIGLGGALLGIIIGGITIIWVKRVFNDMLIEISLIVSAAYLTFFVAEHFLGISGVLALVSLGVVMASVGRTRISPEVQHFLHEFWEITAFIANVLIFVIVGVVIAQRTNPTGEDYLILLLVYGIIHLVRAANMAIFYPLMKKTGYGLPKKDAYVVFWGALRGAIGLALALVVAGDTLHSGAANPIPQEIRDQFLFLVSGIVMMTLLINAPTVKILVDKLGLTKIPAVKALMMRKAFGVIADERTQELELLKGDRFLGGANWSQVRQHMPSMSGPSISESELAQVDTLAETRRRILEKEQKSYWTQFKEGLLGPQAVSRLSKNISELLDHDGAVPLTDRDYLDDLCGRPKFLEALLNVPICQSFIKQIFFDRLALAYDVAKGFVVSQEEMMKLVDSFAEEMGDSDGADVAGTLKKEVSANRLRGLKYLKELHEHFPEITVGIETKQASRTLLNFQKDSINKMQKQGSIEADEAARMVVGVEEKVIELMDKPLELKLPTPIEILREVPWLKGIPESIITKIINMAQEKTYSSGQALMKKGEEGDGMFLISRGSAQVSINGAVVDILGRGNVIGEMSVLAGVPRTADVVADSTVSSLWLSSEDMNKVMAESSDLAMSLWKTAGVRFAENLLAGQDPFRGWSQHYMRRIFSTGNVVAPGDNQSVSLYGKVCVLISGTATARSGEQKVAPAFLNFPEATFTEDAKVFFFSK